MNLAPAFVVKGNLAAFFECQVSTLALSSHTLDLTLTFCAVLGLKPAVLYMLLFLVTFLIAMIKCPNKAA